MPKRRKNYNEWLIGRLTNPSEARRYLSLAMSDSPARFFKALRKVAEAKRIAKVAEEAGVNRESLYRSLSEEGNPEYCTVSSVLRALGMKLDVSLIEPEAAPNLPLGDANQVRGGEAANVISTGGGSLPIAFGMVNSLQVPDAPSDRLPARQIRELFPGLFCGASQQPQTQQACGG